MVWAGSAWGAARVWPHVTPAWPPRAQERVVLKDCQVGAGYVVAEGTEHRDEVLAKPLAQRRSNDGLPARRGSES